MAQIAVDHAEKGDYREVKRILSLLEKPFDGGMAADNSDITAGHTPPGELTSFSNALGSGVGHLLWKAAKSGF